MTQKPSIYDAVHQYLDEKAPILFFVLSREGEIKSANQYARELTGLQLTGRNFYDVIVDFTGEFDLMAAASRSSDEQMINVSSAKGPPETFYFTFQHITNSILAFGKLDADELGTMRKEILSLNQEQGNLMRQLHQANAQLIRKEKALTQSLAELKLTQSKLIESEKMASLGRLVAGFAHEINTPIGIALTASSSIAESSDYIEHLLMQEEVEEDDLISSLETIRDASKLVLSNLDRSAKLVGSFKRTSVDQNAENSSFFNLNDTISDALTSLKTKIKNRSIEVVFDYSERIKCYGVAGDLVQVITNLFENSVLHGFDGGRLNGEIHIKTQQENQRIQIYYSDTGTGMSADIAERIFEPFYTTLRARGGTGLGMYICHNIVTSRLQGTIECSSKQGNGTEFVITFPLSEIGHHEADQVRQ